MPVVGFHQARRPRPTARERLRRDISWPRPGGIILSLAGAALVISGAVALGSTGAAPEPSVMALSTGTTPSPSPSPIATATSSPTPVTSAPPVPTPAPAVAGTTMESAIQQLFVDGNGPVLEPALLNIENPDSPLVLVNKRRPLVPATFVPTDLMTPAIPSGSGEPVLIRAEAGAAAERMFAAAAAEGVNINVKSSYRSYDLQVSLYNSYVADKGAEASDTTSARPGYSEHQTGLALDIGDLDAGTVCDFNECFADTAAARWVASHGADYGFIVRYLPGEESMTGYSAEPWHLRYFGVEIAQDMRFQKILSYEEYLGLPGAPGYE